MKYPIGTEVIMISGPLELRNITGVVVKESKDKNRIWVKWNGPEIDEYLGSEDTLCDTKLNLIRPLTKLEKILK
jgi:hypothetical protein